MRDIYYDYFRRKVMNDMLQSAMNGKRRAGQLDLIKHLKGKKIGRKQAIRAKCYDCNGMGESDICDIDTCSLFPYSQFKPSGKKRHQEEEDRAGDRQKW